MAVQVPGTIRRVNIIVAATKLCNGSSRGPRVCRGRGRYRRRPGRRRRSSTNFIIIGTETRRRIEGEKNRAASRHRAPP